MKFGIGPLGPERWYKQGSGVFLTPTGRTHQVCELSRDCSVEVCNRRARLIAEAPAMLEALRDCVNKWEIRQDIAFKLCGLPVPKDEAPSWIVKIRALIARIEGKEQP